MRSNDSTYAYVYVCVCVCMYLCMHACACMYGCLPHLDLLSSRDILRHHGSRTCTLEHLKYLVLLIFGASTIYLNVTNSNRRLNVTDSMSRSRDVGIKKERKRERERERDRERERESV